MARFVRHMITPASSLITPASSLITPASSLITPASSLITPASRLITPASSLITPASSLITPRFPALIRHGSSLITPGSGLIIPGSNSPGSSSFTSDSSLLIPGSSLITPASSLITPASSLLFPGLRHGSTFSCPSCPTSVICPTPADIGPVNYDAVNYLEFKKFFDKLVFGMNPMKVDLIPDDLISSIHHTVIPILADWAELRVENVFFLDGGSAVIDPTDKNAFKLISYAGGGFSTSTMLPLLAFYGSRYGFGPPDAELQSIWTGCNIWGGVLKKYSLKLPKFWKKVTEISTVVFINDNEGVVGTIKSGRLPITRISSFVDKDQLQQVFRVNFPNFKIHHISGKKNFLADVLAYQALDNSMRVVLSGGAISAYRSSGDFCSRTFLGVDEA